MSTLRFILGDQLSHSISALADIDYAQDVVLMCEVWDEATYVKHHKKKIAFLFSAMRHFAQELQEKGATVDYVTLDDKDNTQSFTDELMRAIKRHKPDSVAVTFPGEYRVLEMMKSWQSSCDISVEILDDHRFLCSPEAFAEWADGRKELRMEYFYRWMRKRYDILLTSDGKPEGGEWNYDEQNRQSASNGLEIPEPYNGQRDAIANDVIALVEERFSDHFGDITPFYFALTRSQARYALKKFIDERLQQFGTYQDAMLQDEPWMFHSHISFYINCGLLEPLECINAAQTAYHEREDVPLSACEGFIRQILGWREFIRGVYWLHMPDYAKENALNAKRPLPEFYWTGETKMNCVRQCVLETKENAYAHHIQRLMVTGNFALLVGIAPEEVNEWYLIVYADAYEWVELPNVTGMALFADGGVFASKPYAAGGSYINKMSNYCKHCSYSVTKKNGDKACPFNYLYWNFLVEHRETFKHNPRIAMMYATYDRMGDDKKQAIRDDASRFLKSL